jgi:hypothetical protein
VAITCSRFERTACSNSSSTRLDHSYEAELRKLLAIDVLIVDDFCLDAMDTAESRDMHEILTERDRIGSVIITFERLRPGRSVGGSQTREGRRSARCTYVGRTSFK